LIEEGKDWIESGSDPVEAEPRPASSQGWHGLALGVSEVDLGLTQNEGQQEVVLEDLN
jgi:hypothetical protein